MHPRSEAVTVSSPPGDHANYTFLIRLPFARADFQDPPQVEWNAEKDAELWDALSKSSVKGQDLDWQELATRFNVNLSFLSQQAAWLYEKQLSQVRAQLRKANQPSSVGTSSPTPDSASAGTWNAGGQPMSRAGSAGSRVPSSLSQRAKERTYSREGGTRPDMKHGQASTLSRKSSAATVTQLSASPPAQRSPGEVSSTQRYRRLSHESSRRSIEASPKFGKPTLERISTSSAIDSDSSTDSEATPQVSASRTFARRPRFTPAKSNLNALSDAEEEEDAAPFLPFSASNTATTHPTPHDPTPAVRSPVRTEQSPAKPASMSKAKRAAMRTVYSSSSSNQSQPNAQNTSPPSRPSTLSPQQRRLAKEAGSEGTPSMGSSFSDLDDASVTQSAMEEAMAREIQAGGVASRMSSISQALKSKYL